MFDSCISDILYHLVVCCGGVSVGVGVGVGVCVVWCGVVWCGLVWFGVKTEPIQTLHDCRTTMAGDATRCMIRLCGDFNALIARFHIPHATSAQP